MWDNSFTALCALGCSMLSPSISQRYCCAVSCRASASLRGHWNDPDSRRLYSSTNPFLSQYSALIRSRRLPQNRNNVLVNGSSENSCCTIVANPSIPLRRSVYPHAIYTLSAPLKSFSMTAAPLSGSLSVPDSFPGETRYTHPRSAWWRNIPTRSATPVSALAALQKPVFLASALHLPLCSAPHVPIGNMSSLKSRFLRTTSSQTGRCFCIPESLPPSSANAPRALIPLTSSFLPPIALVVELPGFFRFVPLLFSHACLCAAGFDGYESLPPAQYAKALGSSRLSFGLWVSFNLWAIVWRLLSQSRKHHCSCDL